MSVLDWTNAILNVVVGAVFITAAVTLLRERRK